MEYINEINTRVSRRVYLDEKISSEKIAILTDAINEINNESGLSIALVEDGSKAFSSTKVTYGMFKNVKTVILLKGPKNDENLQEKLGYFGEKIVLLATSLNLGTCWVGGTYSKDDFLSYVNEGDELVCTITVGCIKESLTFKENLVRKAMHRKSKKIEDIYESDVEITKQLVDALTCVLKAPTAINKQNFLIKNYNNIITFEATADDEYSYIDLGIGKLHFELSAGGKFELGNKGVYNSK